MSDQLVSGQEFHSSDDPKFDPYFIALGRLASSWSELEFHINDCIWEAANVGRQFGACITAQLIGPGPRFRCLVALLKLRNVSDSLIKELNSFSSEAEAVARQRNRFLHDPVVMNKDTGSVSRIEATADRVLKYGFMPLDLKDVQDLTTQIVNLTNVFDHLYLRIISETPPWPRTQFGQSVGIRINRQAIGSDPSKPERPLELPQA